MSTITERLERTARALELEGHGFEKVGHSAPLVMCTPTTVVVATTLFATQFVTAWAAGSAKLADGKSLDGLESPSLEDLLKLHEEADAVLKESVSA